jgi:glyoxylase-like metal-dependent hydrolase (beta-lactamase superfamily II)
MKFQTVKPDLLLKEGDEIEGFKIIHTPGHTPGSISLYGKEVLFSGDALQVNRKGNLTPSRKLMASDIKQAWESIRKINNLNLEFKILLPGHRKVILKDASKMLKDLLSNRSK